MCYAQWTLSMTTTSFGPIRWRPFGRGKLNDLDVGAASSKLHDVSLFVEFWLASLLVRPDYRRRTVQSVDLVLAPGRGGGLVDDETVDGSVRQAHAL